MGMKKQCGRRAAGVPFWKQPLPPKEDPMCDFSLESYGRRLAREGETYKVARFPSGTMGLAPTGGN